MSDIDLFVDELLDDTVRRLERERDVEPAWGRSECARMNLAVRPPACVNAHAMQLTLARQARAGMPPTAAQQLALNDLRGRCAEQNTARRLCQGRFDVFNQARVRPRDRSSPRLDIGPFHTPAPGRVAPRGGLEIKHVHLPDYVNAAGALDVARLQAQVRAHAAQVIDQMAAVAGTGAHAGRGAVRPGMPARIRLMYHLGGLGELRRREAALGLAPMRSPSSARPMPRAAVAAQQAIRQAAANAGVSAWVVPARL
jgi:hypothetical protein